MTATIEEIRIAYDALQSKGVVIEPPSVIGNGLIGLLGIALDKLTESGEEFIRMEDSWRREVERQEHERCETEIELERACKFIDTTHELAQAWNRNDSYADAPIWTVTKKCANDLDMLINEYNTDRPNAHNGMQTLLSQVKRYGKKPVPNDWIDEWGACKICEGEIPHGHSPDCAYYSLEIQLKDAITAQVEMGEEMNALRDGRQAAEDQYQDVVADLGHSIDRIMKLESQLPEGMQDCTLFTKKCEVGHTELTATNWEQHEAAGCRQCTFIEADALIKKLQPLIDKHLFKW
jgi:hypothetical protein